jgi:O-antigen/teichoic acid export membrane protein
VKRTLWRSVLLCLLFSGMVALGFVAAGKPLVGILSRHKVVPSLLLLLGLACWTVIGNVCNATAMFLNGVGAMREQAYGAVVMAVAALALKIFLGLRFGVAGVIWATVAAYMVINVPWTIYLVPHTLRRLTADRPATEPVMPDLENQV